MRQVDFENGKISTNMLQQAFPMFVAQVINLLYSIVDRIYIGRIPGEGTLALGGVGLCFPIITMVIAFTNLYGSGGSPLCAMARGRGREDEAEYIMNTSFRLEVITGLLLTMIGMCFGREILKAFGASDQAMYYALPYLRIYLCGTVFAMISTGMNPFINAQGFSQIGMMTVVIGAAMNIVLDPIFIFVLGLGVRGAALATIIAQAVSALFVLNFLYGKKSPAILKIRIDRSNLLPELKTSMEIISLGLSAFIMMFTNGLVTMVSNSALASTGGDIYISVMTLLSSLRQVVEVPAASISEGASPIMSYNFGAGRSEKVKKTIKYMFCAELCYTVTGWLAIERFPKLLLGIFTNDPELIQAALPAMHIYFIAFVFMTFQHCAQFTFKALGKKKRTIFFSLFRKVIIVIPLTLILPGMFGLGVMGVFMAEAISNVVGGMASFTTMLITLIPEINALTETRAAGGQHA